ncbi:uncharacterized protein BDZ99DRAFT_570581 [Mytilinidion resinicola]|uniref:PLAC8-domain-containing protein n=1 Tax=Mytilinidion resinicola TaxID=574789 RepID=A0A6A6YPZ6_9PEZI|nr:uncharacterized protein BDZ99DRAFT_570581 [Mytilinidion resinicola]KAF2809947.1 hypothetical protein BDZ99DRAFT_570581 [Mytilinidion resinicola]
MSSPTYPQTAGHPAQNMDNWNNRFNNVVNEASAPPSTGPKQARTANLFDCCVPPELCFLTYCCPCVTFGKSTHRMENDGNMTNFGPVNVMCVVYYCLGPCAWILVCAQETEARRKYKLDGNLCTDCLKSCCCTCCTLMQQEKESIAQEGKPNGQSAQQYQSKESMVARPQSMSGPPSQSRPSQDASSQGPPPRAATFGGTQVQDAPAPATISSAPAMAA